MKWKKIRYFFHLLFLSLKELIKDKADVYAGGLAYFQFLSVTPLVGFIVYFFSHLYGEDKTREELLPILNFWFPKQFISVMKFLLSFEQDLQPNQLFTISWIAGLAMVWATRAYFAQVRDSIEGQWNSYKDEVGFKAALSRNWEDGRTTLISLLIMIAFVIFLALLPNLPQDPSLSPSPIAFYLIGIMRFIVGFMFLFTLLLYFFTNLPPQKIQWTDAVPGAMLGAILQVAGRQILKWHIAHNPTASIPESMIVMLAWFYYSGMVLLHASEFSKVYITNKRKLTLTNSKSHQ
jgi:uncharacterized BrkB/YihY/UPF0761 family membrane protein